MYAVQTESHDCPVSARSSPIFIGGQRRSGTTLLRTLLDRHPHMAAVPSESHFLQDERFERFFRGLLDQYGNRFARLGIGPPEMDRAVASFVNSLFMRYQSRKRAHRWVEKDTENINIDYLFRLFPDAQFIHMIRDPRDTLCSIEQRAATDRPDWVKFTAEVTAREWVHFVAAGLPWREQPERYIEVHYEQLVRDPEAELRRVLAFLGEPWCPAVLDTPADSASGTHKRANYHKPVFTSSIGRWTRDLSREEVARIQSIAGETMALLGYDVEAI